MAPSVPSLLTYALYLASLVSAALCGAASAVASPPVVATKNGSYSGLYSTQYNQDFFLGIPYAQPPSRFAVSKPLNSSWSSIHNATTYPPHCIGYGGDDTGYALSEDCLYLNVIRPSGINATSNLPVAVWIHGGGLYMGGSADRRYNLSFIVSNSVSQSSPMIAVSLNYRLSAFGFIGGHQVSAAGSTNLGFRDQRLALHWISENIATFGGDPSKVTIWGESSGAESVSAQVLAYNGRDDGLFRGAVGESGFGAVLPRYAGQLNATAAVQAAYDSLVQNTTCATAVDSLSCLSALPFAQINAVLNTSAAGPWPPVLDGDFIAGHPGTQLREGRFVRVPILIGTNTDEGTAFGAGRGPDGAGVDTDAQMATAVGNIIGPDAATETGRSNDELVRELLYLYPNIQAVGIPSLEKFPAIVPGDTIARMVGAQYRRTGALFGDYTMHYARRRANLAWAQYGVPSYSYRFDVTVNGIPAFVAATHFQEVAFVLDNVAGDGYATDPFANETAAFPALAKTMSTAWVNFIVGLDPNGAGLGLRDAAPWPVYNATTGGGLGQNVVFTVVESSYVEGDSWRAEGIAWMIENGLTVFGS